MRLLLCLSLIFFLHQAVEYTFDHEDLPRLGFFFFFASRAVQAWYGNLLGKPVHIQLIEEHSSTVISAC